MPDSSNLSRRTALAGLGAGSLGLFLGAHAAANGFQPAYETGGVPDISLAPMADHKLNGRWLSLIGLPSNPDTTVAVPTFFGPDGTTVMIFPGIEAAKRGLEVRGVALGEWEPIGPRSAHFTAVQVLASMEGGYIGTMTIDGYAALDDDDQHFSVRTDDHIFTLRDAANHVTELVTAPAANPMRGVRMRAGNPGFEDAPRRFEQRTPD